MSFPLGREYSPLNPLDYIGYWGPVTLTIDWCEENYIISPYFAEFVNATTNLSFFMLSMYHLYTAIVNKHGPLFIFISIGMCTVGLGSWLFHMTLRYEFQLMDELPMIYVTAIPSAYIFAYNRSKWGQRMTYLTIFVFMFLMTFIYCFIWKNPILHQVCYAGLNFSIIYRSIAIIQIIVPTSKQRWFMYKILMASFGLFGFGFFIWNIDNEFCSGLISLRRHYLGLPYGFVLEGHGWWHIFTSWGIYYFILYMEVLVTWMEDVQDNYYINWKWGFIAQVLLKEGTEGILDKQGWGDKKLNKVD